MAIENKQTIDSMLTQATCSVFLKGELVGTAWLANDKGVLITAGHILGKTSPINEVEIKFPGEDSKVANRINWGYQFDMGIDFAILKIKDFESTRRPLPISLATEVVGKFMVRGYGRTLSEQSVGHGIFLGSYHPQDCIPYRLFQMSSKELGEVGYSGSAVFSEELKAVVAIQIEVTGKNHGAGRDTILAMPIYRIQNFYNDIINGILPCQKHKISKAKKRKIKEILSIDIEELKFYPCKSRSVDTPCQVNSLCLISELLRNESTINETVQFIIHLAELWSIADRLESLLQNSNEFLIIKNEYDKLRRKMKLVYDFFSELKRPYIGDQSWRGTPHKRLAAFISSRIRSHYTQKKDLFINSFEVIFDTLNELVYKEATEKDIVEKLKAATFIDALSVLVESYGSIKDQLDILSFDRRIKTKDSLIQSFSDDNSENFHDRLEFCLKNLPHNKKDLPPIWSDNR